MMNDSRYIAFQKQDTAPAMMWPDTVASRRLNHQDHPAVFRYVITQIFSFSYVISPLMLIFAASTSLYYFVSFFHMGIYKIHTF